MPIAKIQLEDGRIAKFEVPDGTTEAEVLQFVQDNRSQFDAPAIDQPETKEQSIEQQLNQGINPLNRRDQLIKELAVVQPTGDMSKIQPLVDELQSIEELTGGGVEAVLEPLATVASSVVAEPIAGVAGIGQALNPFAEQGAGSRAVEATRDALTFKPRTQTGQAGLEAVGGALQPVGEALAATEDFLGDTALDITGSPAAAATAATLPTALMALIPASKIFKNSGKLTKAQRGIVAELKANPRNPNFAKFIPETGKQSGALKEAVKQSGSPELVAVIKSSSKADKAVFSEMLRVIKKGKVDPVFADKVRVGDVVGKSLTNRLGDLKKLNSKAGKLVDDVARNELKGNIVDVSSAKGAFKSGLDDLRVGYDTRTGAVNFKGSALEGAGAGQARDLVKNLANRLKKDSINATDAHFMKRLIDQKVSFGKSDSGFSGQIDRTIKSLRKGLNDSISDKFPAYSKANKKYSESINAMNNFQDSAGKVDLSSKEALGVSARRLTSNTQSRAKMLDSLDEIQDVLSRNGIKYKDDILTQTHVANALDRRFKTQAATGFEKSIAEAGAEVMGKTSENLVMDVIGGAAKKLSGVTDDKAIDALIRISN